MRDVSPPPFRLDEAYACRDLPTFLGLVFPPAWAGIAARIIESGATMRDAGPWAPRWTPIPATERTGRSPEQTKLKSILFRVHDCLHNLWGLPHPIDYSEDEKYHFKRAYMCGEVAVLTLTEFWYCDWLYQTYPQYRAYLLERNALPMLYGPLQGKSKIEVAIRIDELLHKKLRPKWVRQHDASMRFCDDYVPMLEADRRRVDVNWEGMEREGWSAGDAPNAPFGRAMTGVELTTWMIADFDHQLFSTSQVDVGLARLNEERRRRVALPVAWVY